MPNNIDPTRLAAIFKTLTATDASKSKRADHEKPAKKTDNSQATELKRVKRPNKEDLKRRLRLKLEKLKLDDENFEKNAPKIAVKEVLFWEFGDDFINHPDFKYLNSKILVQINSSDKLLSAFKGMVKTLLE